MAEHSLLQPLPPRIGARGSARQMRVTGHQPARTAANESDHPGHLNRASAKARPRSMELVAATRIRVYVAPGELPGMTTVPQELQRIAATLWLNSPDVRSTPPRSPSMSLLPLNFTPGDRPTTTPSSIRFWHSGQGRPLLIPSALQVRARLWCGKPNRRLTTEPARAGPCRRRRTAEAARSILNLPVLRGMRRRLGLSLGHLWFGIVDSGGRGRSPSLVRSGA